MKGAPSKKILVKIEDIKKKGRQRNKRRLSGMRMTLVIRTRITFTLNPTTEKKKYCVFGVGSLSFSC
jgi:hypothetical protein